MAKRKKATKKATKRATKKAASRKKRTKRSKAKATDEPADEVEAAAEAAADAAPEVDEGDIVQLCYHGNGLVLTWIEVECTAVGEDGHLDLEGMTKGAKAPTLFENVPHWDGGERHLPGWRLIPE